MNVYHRISVGNFLNVYEATETSQDVHFNSTIGAEEWKEPIGEGPLLLEQAKDKLLQHELYQFYSLVLSRRHLHL